MQLKNHKLITLTIAGLLTAICIIGQIVCSSLPNIQPTTTILMLTSIFISPVTSIEISCAVILINGIMFGFGIWIPFQIIGYVVCIMMIYWLNKRITFIKAMTVTAISAFVYGFITNLSMLFFIDTMQLIPCCIAAIPFDAYHCIGNIVFVSIFYYPFKYLSQKYQLRRI